MKIGIIYDRIYPFAIGGGEKRNWEVARRLAARDHQVELIGMRYWKGGTTIERERVTLVGVCDAIRDFNEEGKRSFAQPVAFAIGVWRYLRKQQFDVIECSNFPYLSSVAARLACWRRAGLTICWFEARGLSGWWHYQRAAGVIAYLFEMIVSRLTRFNTAISERTEARARKVLGMRSNRITMIPCGVDNAAFEQSRETQKVDQVIYVGRLVQHKRVDLLLRALRLVSTTFPLLRVKLVGMGDREENLRKLSAELGLCDRVTFVQQLDADALAREIAASRLFVLPSEQEGFGLVIVEALAAGTPVIALDSPLSAAATIIEHGIDGMLATNERQIADHISALLFDPHFYHAMRQAGFTKAASYDWDERIIPALEEHYRDVANNCGVSRGANASVESTL